MIKPVFAVPPGVVAAHDPAPRRRVVVLGVAFVVTSMVLGAAGAGLVLSRGRGGRTHQDRVFEAMVAAPITAMEADPAPVIAVVAPVAPPRAQRLRPVAASPSPSPKAAPIVAPPGVVAALPREAMPPPFVVVY